MMDTYLNLPQKELISLTAIRVHIAHMICINYFFPYQLTNSVATVKSGVIV